MHHTYNNVICIHAAANKTTAVDPTKFSSDDDSEVKHYFGANASLPLTQSMSTISYNTTRHYQFSVTLWEC